MTVYDVGLWLDCAAAGLTVSIVAVACGVFLADLWHGRG